MTRDVLILTQCAPHLGVGHLSRSLVLAQALRARGAAVRFALTTPHCLADTQGFPVSTAAETAPADDLLIVDGYRITDQEISALWTEHTRACALIDDVGGKPRDSQMLVNFQLYAETVIYRSYPAFHRVLGPYYFPLRPGFAELRTHNERAERRALLTFGGGATGGFGFEAARALARRFDGPIDLAIGAMGPADEDMPGNVTVHRNADLVALMRRATLYVGSLGTSFTEAVGAGLPIVGCPVAADQKAAYYWARTRGAVLVDKADAEQVADDAAWALNADLPPMDCAFPDGQGADRLAAELLEFDPDWFI